MKYLRGSIVVCFFVSIFKAFARSYENSIFKRAVAVFALMFRESIIGRALHKYIFKKPFYENSLTYKVIMSLAGCFDRLFGRLNTVGSSMLRGSSLIGAYRVAIKDCSALFAVSIILMSAPVGSLLAMLLAGSAPRLGIIICAAVFALGAIVGGISLFPNVFKNCFIVKAILWFADALS